MLNPDDLVEQGWERPSPGFTILGDVEWSGYSYEFDLTRVYRHDETGRLFYGDDSGCSCPTPFESKRVSDLVEITRPQVFLGHVADRRQRDRETLNGNREGQIAALYEAVVKAWRAAQ